MPIEPKSFLYGHDAESGIAQITLNRPDRLNALDMQLADEDRELFDHQAQLVRVLVPQLVDGAQDFAAEVAHEVAEHHDGHRRFRGAAGRAAVQRQAGDVTGVDARLAVGVRRHDHGAGLVGQRRSFGRRRPRRA